MWSKELISVTATRTRVQTSASGRWWDKLDVKISDCHNYIDKIFIKMESEWPDWILYRSFKDNEDKTDFDFYVVSIASWRTAHEDIAVMVIDKKDNIREFSF